MNSIPISALQQQFPLSPKKFWKKMIEKLVAWYVLAIIMVVIDLILIVMTSDTDSKSAIMILWAALVVGMIIMALITVMYAWYLKVYIRRYYYSGEEHFITIKKGVFAPSEIHVQWQKIQDVYVDQDILDRIMGLYDVHIASATAASSIEAHIDGVEKSAAEGLKNFLLNKVSGAGRNSSHNSTVGSVAKEADVKQSKVSSINLKEEISSDVYPLLGKWLAIKLVSRFVSPFVYWAFLILLIFGSEMRDISPNDYWMVILGYLGVSILSIIIQTISLFLWRKNYAFNFASDNIFYREGVISLSEKHMPYSSIQDVTVQQGILERMVGLAKVRIENAAQQTMQMSRGRTVSVFTGVILQGISLEDANKITNILKTTVLGKNTAHYGL